MEKINRIDINKTIWRIIIFTSIVIGIIVFSIFNSTFYIPSEYTQAVWYASIGLMIAGIGIGFMFSRVFKIKGIDN